MVCYKYFPPERKTFLSELLIRFTPPGSLNDPYDTYPAFHGFDETFVKGKVLKAGLDSAFSIALEESDESVARLKINLIQPANKILQKQYLSKKGGLDEQFSRLHRNRVNSEIGVLCLCESAKSVVMWWHYAIEHTGFVVGFDSGDSFFAQRTNEPVDIGVLLPVNYSKERPLIDVRMIKQDANLPDIIFTKNQEWSYEHEFRLVRFLTGADEIRNENVHLFQVPPTAIREVIFGLNTDSLVKQALLDATKQNAKLKHVRFFSTELSKTRYEMEILPYTD